jgi:hypothetical protein
MNSRCGIGWHGIKILYVFSSIKSRSINPFCIVVRNWIALSKTAQILPIDIVFHFIIDS